LTQNSPVLQRKAEYRDIQMKLAWHSSVEDDPILLYIRAKDFEDKKEHSQQLRYLKSIVENHPDFVHARKKLILACWEIAKKKKERSELVLAQDLAKEFLEKFPRFLTEDEKRECNQILKATKKRRKQRKGK
jgi:predicted nucleic acid-binding protein